MKNKKNTPALIADNSLIIMQGEHAAIPMVAERPASLSDAALSPAAWKRYQACFARIEFPFA